MNRVSEQEVIMSRDADFSSKTIREIAERVGYHCSNPTCRRLTRGPKKHSAGSVNMGVAAHIVAARPKGPRFDSTLSVDKRKHPDNGIWLCQACSVLIDKDPVAYTVGVLNEWKEYAEKAAEEGLTHAGTFAAGMSNARTVGIVHRYLKPSKVSSFNKPLKPGYSWTQKVSYHSLIEGDERIIHNVHLPMVFQDSLGPSSNHYLFVLCLQNLGTGVEPYAKMSIHIEGAPFWKVTSSFEGRLKILGNVTETETSGKVEFSIENLMPDEAVSIEVYSRSPGPFNVEQFSSASNMSSIPMVSDVRFGPVKMVKTPPRDPSFKKKQYPFG